jgi:hypothetical protein
MRGASTTTIAHDRRAAAASARLAYPLLPEPRCTSVRRLRSLLPLLALAAVLAAPAAAETGPCTPASDDVDIITPDYFTPMAQVPDGGVLGAQHTIRAVEAHGRIAPGASVAARVEGTGADAGRVLYVDRGAGVDLASTFIVSLRFERGAATIAGVAKSNGTPVSFTVHVRAGRAGARGTFAISLSNGYSRSGPLQGRLLVG